MSLDLKKNFDVAQKLPFDFTKGEFKLGGWGQVDFFSADKNVYVFLEVEKSQSHPNTNVLKIWPFLEDNSKSKVLLIHVFEPGEKRISPNRIKLCDFIAEKIENKFPDRFRYYRMKWSDMLTDDIKIIQEKHKQLQ